MNLKGITLSEIRQRIMLHDLTYMWILTKVKYIEAESYPGREGVGGDGEMLVKGYKIAVIDT